jgi:hypothetical protein
MDQPRSDAVYKTTLATDASGDVGLSVSANTGTPTSRAALANVAVSAR